jgi:uncharacterized membrane protein
LAAITVDVDRRAIHPFHAALLGGMVPLFLGGLIADAAYMQTAQIQWSNFASWLIAGAMVFTGFTLLWALIEIVAGWRGRPVLYFLLVLAAFVIGLFNSFVHARDAWGAMPEALIVSAITTVVALAATFIGFSSLRTRVLS